VAVAGWILLQLLGADDGIGATSSSTLVQPLPATPKTNKARELQLRTLYTPTVC